MATESIRRQLTKKRSGSVPHRKLWDIPTNTQGWEQRIRKRLHVCSGPAHILQWLFYWVENTLSFCSSCFFSILSFFCLWKVSCSGQGLSFTMFMTTLNTKHHTSTAVNGAMTILINLQTLILTSHCQNNAGINTNEMILLKIFMEKSTLRLILQFFVLFSKKTPPFSKIFVRFYTMTNLKSSITPPNNK